MNFELHFKSIAMRWFVNIFVMIAALVIVCVLAFSAVFSSVYTERITSLANDYSYEYETLSSTTADSFEDAAISISDAFLYKTKLEVQVLDNSGKVIVSTTGFQAAEDNATDYIIAKKSSSGIGTYKGKNAGGEQILASTSMITDSDGNPLGAYRWIVSMKSANRKIREVLISLSLIGLGVIGFCAISGLFFIKSIVRPIRDVSNTARKIAMGDFEARIDIEKNDEIGELCDTINYMASELSQAETMKNDFISSVSHELRTPLTAIRGWGETAKMSMGTDDELVARGLDVVLSEADRLSGLVEELLDFSRMQSGRLTVNTAPTDVSAMLCDAADMYTELAKKQGIELSYTPPATHAVVMGDADRLKQVFINIIDNAVKYTEKGGLVLIMQTFEEGCVRILVKDTGVGIPAQDIDHVKEKFFKSNKTVRGSGIGLAVADEIIKQHKGLLFLESTEGVGTTVTIVLPLYEEPKAETESEPALTESSSPDTEIAAEITAADEQSDSNDEITEGNENG